MAIVLAKTNFAFPSVTGSVQKQVRSINLGRTVQHVAVMLTGFNVQYDNGDHHVLQESKGSSREPVGCSHSNHHTRYAPATPSGSPP